MAHYAFLNDNNIVTEVITGVDEDQKDDLPEDLTAGKTGTLTLEVRLAKELHITL